MPLGTALILRILRVSRRGEHAMYKREATLTSLGGDVGGAQAKLSASNNKTGLTGGGGGENRGPCRRLDLGAGRSLKNQVDSS